MSQEKQYMITFAFTTLIIRMEAETNSWHKNKQTEKHFPCQAREMAGRKEVEEKIKAHIYVNVSVH